MARNYFFRFAKQRRTKITRKPKTRRRSRPLGVVDLGIESLEDRRLLAAGDLDLTFNGTGFLIQSFGAIETGDNTDTLGITVQQADGKILIAGSYQSGGASATNFGVARFNPNGSVDTTFGAGADLDGVNGLATADLGTSTKDVDYDVKIDSAGRILLVGRARDGLGIGIARFTSTGQLDTTFNGTGTVFTALSNAEPHAIGLQSDGTIVVGGWATVGGGTDFFVARYNTSGTIIGGITTTNLGGVSDQAYDMAIQGDDKIVLAGTNNADFALVRYTAAGVLDSTFNGTGIVTTNMGGTSGSLKDVAHSVAIQSDGKIVAGGIAAINASISFMGVARYNTTGLLDTSFNSSGAVPGTTQINIPSPINGLQTDFDNSFSMALQPDGKIVVAGESQDGSTSNEQIVVARLTSAGLLDTGFGPGPGFRATNLVSGTTAERLLDVAIQPDGKIIAGGTINSADFLLVRYDSGLVVNTIAGAPTVNEGATYTLNLSASDPTTTQWTINWGDSIQVVPGNPPSVTHVYADGPNSYTISATVTNSSGTFAAGNTQSVTVNNVAPTLTIAGTSSVNEGSLYTLSLSSTDPGPDTITSWTINWGDSTQVVAGNPSSVTHTYADGPNSYTISATATDEDGTYSAGTTVALTVNNVAPLLAISGAAVGLEGSPYTLSLSSSDPGADTISSWTINWGDTTQVVAGNPSSVTHIYADGPNSYTISATATDEDGTFAAGNTVAVTVNNVAPTLTISGAATVNEGALYTLGLSSSDAGADTITSWTINWGDSTEAVAGNPSSVTHTYADGPNGYTISATATDEDGTYSSNSISVTVDNVAPTLTISGAANVNEGSLYTLNLSSSDTGTDTITSWTINWGDSTQVVAGNPSSVTHTYADGPNGYTMSATATDEDGTFAANSISVTVDNVAPTLTISGAAAVNEGALYTLTLSSSDPGTDTIASWTINWGDSTQVVAGNPSSVTHTYADGPNSYTISASATDEDGTFAAGNTVAVTVSNVDPTLTITGAANVNEGALYTLNLSSTDPGADTIASWTINWGDSTQVVAGNPSSVTHTYADGPSGYTITATATDEDGTYASNSVAVTVDNVAPTADAGGPYATFDDTSITLHGTATDPAGPADPLTYTWDLDDNGSFETSGSDPVFNPVALGFSGTQTHTVKMRVSDGDGGITTVSTTVQLLGEGTLLIDGVLYVVGGNSTNDIVLITQCGSQIQVCATFNSNNPASFNAADVTEIQVRTRGGNDIVLTTPNVTKLMTIDGGSGNDLLTGGGGRNLILGGIGNDALYGAAGDDVLLGGDGNDDLLGGSGNDVLVGGNGNDVLCGGSGRDLIVGSDGNDTLQGGGDEDILIGGYTIHDNNVAALDAVMAIWTSAASFSSRVATLTASGGLLQAGVAVFDDSDHDTMDGGAGRDLYFGDITGGDKDVLSIQQTLDSLVVVD